MAKIMVVDDEEKNRKLLKDVLEIKGHNVITANGGKEALEKIKEGPAIVLLDIMMPGMNGLQVLDEIKKIAPSIDVIMVTAFNEHAVGLESLKRGAFDFVTKPIDLKHLETVIEFKLLEGSLENVHNNKASETLTNTPGSAQRKDIPELGENIPGESQTKRKAMGEENQNIKILILDDNERDLKLLEAKLLQLGFQHISKARQGVEALELAKKHLPDLIFSDIIMPGLDGGAVKEQLKEDPKTKDIPIIFLSSIISKKEQKGIGGLTGGSVIVSKPYSSEDILEAINRALKL